MNPEELKDFLDRKVLQYNTLDFIASASGVIRVVPRPCDAEYADPSRIL
jgi:hypothetical protein